MRRRTRRRCTRDALRSMCAWPASMRPAAGASATQGAARSAERDMARERISCFSTPTEAHASANTSGFYEWMFNGLRVYRAFENTHPASREKTFRGEPVCIETFPHAITCALLGRDEASAKLKRTQRKALLETLGFDVSGLKSIDAIDAARCARSRRNCSSKERRARTTPMWAITSSCPTSASSRDRTRGRSRPAPRRPCRLRSCWRGRRDRRCAGLPSAPHR